MPFLLIAATWLRRFAATIPCGRQACTHRFPDLIKLIMLWLTPKSFPMAAPDLESALI